MPKVFISSTYTDLIDYRGRAISVCSHLGLEPVTMEHMNAMDADAVEGSKKKLGIADLYVGIFAHRYGTIPDGDGLSITEQEYEYAREKEMPRLCFLVDEEYGWSPKLMDFDNYSKLQAFKEKIGKERIVAYFTSVEDFGEKLTQALVEWKEQFKDEEETERGGSRAVSVKGPVNGSMIITGNGNTVNHYESGSIHLDYQEQKKQAHAEYLEALSRDCQRLALGTLGVSATKAGKTRLDDIYIDLDTEEQEYVLDPRFLDAIQEKLSGKEDVSWKMFEKVYDELISQICVDLNEEIDEGGLIFEGHKSQQT